ncbi:MAG: ArsB/NhaD family transporter [Candidatus Peribacteraceae bacterium]|nr:ArsB/NhaD family transporter [Candidatus Peribacteraceae bacterium]
MQELAFNTPMLVSAIILGFAFIGIFTEELHGIHRSKAALAGAVAMIIGGQIFGFYGPELALEAIDWNVVFLLACMMTTVAIMAPTGGFQAIAYFLADFSKGRQFLLLAMLGTAVTVISLLLDNVTTVVIFGPLIVLITAALKISPIPYLITIAVLSNTGGIATLVGDPPNLMIGSAAGIDFMTFLTHMGGIVIAVWLATLLAVKFIFRKSLSQKALVPHFEKKEHVKDPQTWYVAVAVMAIMIVLFILHSRFGWEAWFVSAIGLSLLMLFGRKIDLDRTFEDVEITLLMFFISLFVIVGGVEHSEFLQWIGQFIVPFVQNDLTLATIVLLWVSAFLSAAIDNIPFTAAMIPIILGMEAQGLDVHALWWALALGVGLGGNGTHLGSTANVFVVTLSERIARQTGDQTLAIKPGAWIKKGTPIMLTSLVVASVLFYIFFDFFNTSFERTGGQIPVAEAAEHLE